MKSVKKAEKPIVFDTSFNMQDHQWVQRSNQLTCETCPYTHTVVIPPGKMLTGKRGEWQLIDE